MSGQAARFVRAHLYGTVVICTFVVIPALALRRFDASLVLAVPDALRWAGLLLIAAGGGLSYYSFWLCITRGRGTAFPTEPPKEMLVFGPYKYVRNPMYIGNLAMVFGAGLWFSSAVVLLYAVALCFVTHVYVTLLEERGLTERYGDLYLRYVKTIPRWLPRRP